METAIYEINRNSISKANACEYVDRSSDGGFWLVNEPEGLRFAEVTPKMLKVLGYESLEEMESCKAWPEKIIVPNWKKKKLQAEVDEIISGDYNHKYINVCLIKKDGTQEFGQANLVKSVLYPLDNGRILVKAELRLFNIYEAIFNQSKTLLDQLHSGIAIFHCSDEKDYRVIYMNEGLQRLVNLSKNEPVLGGNALDKIYPEDKDKALAAYQKALSTGECITENYRLLRNGKPIWARTGHKSVRIGTEKYLYVSSMDINELKVLQEDTERKHDRLYSFVNSTPAGLCVFKESTDGTIVRAVNDTFVSFIEKSGVFEGRIEGSVNREALRRMKMEEMMAVIDPVYIINVESAVKVAKEAGISECTFKIRKEYQQTGTWIRAKIGCKKRTKGIWQITVVFDNVTRQVENELALKMNRDALLQMNYHDGMTGVLNRNSYNEYRRIKRSKVLKDTGMMFVDLNGLKHVNEIMGHASGDEMLVTAVNIMEKYFEAEKIYRISGDEFLIIEENCDRRHFDYKSAKLTKEMEDNELASTGSIWSDSIVDLSGAIDRVEELMRISKKNFYSIHQDLDSKHRPVMLKELLRDIEDGQYKMLLQPKAYISSHQIVGAEALIRKREADGTVIFPEKFIHRLEKEGLISFLDHYMLENACKFLENWKLQGREKIKISVNLSRVTIAEPDCINHLIGIVSKYKIDRSSIEFEITESSETIDQRRLEETIAELSKLGFGISLDDMGTEYSTLSMLPIEDIDTVKLDRSFILKINDANGSVLLKHVIQMCHDMGKICVAEGVEDDETREILMEMNCDMYQGFLLSEPVPPEAFELLFD